ncbi:MAG: response regulator transcription factor [Conexibacter sp.]|nr:response regulator transcription factor [Conexibacter sp.]
MSPSRPVPTAIWVVPPADRRIAVAVIGTNVPWASRVKEILTRDGVRATVRCGHSLEAARDMLDLPLDVVLLAHRHGSSEAERRIRRIHRRRSRPAIVVAVSEADEHAVRGLVAAGVDGLVAETEIDATLAIVVRAVCAGHISVPQQMRYLIEPPALSHREKQVLALAIVGRTNAEIALRLCLGESTVKSHLSSAFRRLGVHSRREAAAAVLNHDERLRQGVMMTLHGGAEDAGERPVEHEIRTVPITGGAADPLYQYEAADHVR